MMLKARALYDQFPLPDGVCFETGRNGMIRLSVSTSVADAHIYLYGAHVSHYQPAGQEPVLFISEQSFMEKGKPIRGGIPVIFPWFGPHEDSNLPAHGILRTAEWHLETVAANGDGFVTIELSIDSDADLIIPSPFPFRAKATVKVGKTLEYHLEIENTGPEEISFEEALHSYFTVEDVRDIKVVGLRGVSYKDKVDGMEKKLEQDESIIIHSEVDRVYEKTRNTVEIDDLHLNRVIIVSKENSDTTVVWNPWIDKAKALQDLADDDWIRFVCVETANASASKVSLPAGETHTMKLTIEAKSLIEEIEQPEQ